MKFVIGQRRQHAGVNIIIIRRQRKRRFYITRNISNINVIGA